MPKALALLPRVAATVPIDSHPSPPSNPWLVNWPHVTGALQNTQVAVHGLEVCARPSTQLQHGGQYVGRCSAANSEQFQQILPPLGRLSATR